MFSKIIGTGRYLPERVVTNRDFEAYLDTTDAWIQERTGIKQRHVAAEGETTVDLAEHAARAALAAANLAARDIDMIVMGTTTPDQVFPNSAVLLQYRLGIGGIPAFSLETACSGFIYALGIADRFIRTQSAHRILVVGAETFTHLLDWQDRSTCILFGDGAGAVILESSEQPGILSSQLHADGRYKDLLGFASGIGKNFQHVAEDAVHMRGNEVFKIAVNTLSQSVMQTLEQNKLDKQDIDWLIPHQANLRIIQAIARKLDMPMEKVVVTVDMHGNTSAASVPMALDVAVRDGRIQRGDLLLLEAFGGGFTWGAALVQY